MVGEAFTALTVKTKLVDVLSVPSLTVIVMVEVPFCSVTGVMITLRSVPDPPKLIFATGTNVVFDEAADTVKDPGGVSASPLVNAIAEVGVFSFVDWAPIAVIVGAPLALTVSTKLVEVVVVPSLTFTVIVLVPLSPFAGVMTRFRFAPLPPITILAFGMRVVLEDVAVTVNEPGGVSGSPTVKAIAEVGVF